MNFHNQHINQSIYGSSCFYHGDENHFNYICYLYNKVNNAKT